MTLLGIADCGHADGADHDAPNQVCLRREAHVRAAYGGQGPKGDAPFHGIGQSRSRNAVKITLLGVWRRRWIVLRGRCN